MRRLAQTLAVALALGMLVAGSVSAANTNLLVGDWIGNDPAPPDGDGSVVRLSIRGSDHPQVTFTDEYGTVCENLGSPVTEFRATLTGFMAKSLLIATFRTAQCGPVAVRFLQGERMFLQHSTNGTEDPSDDTLDDGSVIWHRA